MLKELLTKSRSYRRFHQDVAMDLETLRELVGWARLTPSAGNLQPLKYVLSSSRAMNEQIFRLLGWAGYLKEWPGPEEGERPAAYIVMLGDREISGSFGYDAGIAAQTILLGATEKGFGGCMIGSVNREKLARILELPSDRFEILLVLALGKPKEEVVLEALGSDGRIQYWRDEHAVHHVPKRLLEDLICREFTP
jgi:nitroreductase